MLKASKVTYPYSKEPYRVHAQRLAPSQCRLSPSLSDEEFSSPRRNSTTKSKSITKRAKKPKSPCTKNIMKDVNDNNKQTKDPTESKLLHLTDSAKSSKSKSQNMFDKQALENTDKKEIKNKNKEKNDSNKNTTETNKSTKHKIDHKQNINKEIKGDEGTKPKKVKLESLKTTVDKSATDTQVDENKWTRDEDKKMLEMLKGEARSEELFCKIRKLLPHRSMTEIQDRFSHVMNLLQQMAVGEVT